MSIGKTPCPICQGPMHRGSPRCVRCFRREQSQTIITPVAQIGTDRDRRRLQAEISSLKNRYSDALRTIEQQDKALGALRNLGVAQNTFHIEPVSGSGTSEGTAVMVASDWHMEETVGGEVGGLNSYNLEIAHQRAERFFQAGGRLVELLNQDIGITTIILALLGDFISNDIHEEFPEHNALLPMHALGMAESHLISGIQFLLETTDAKIVIPCHSGNHARTTQKTRFATENGHSLEYLMYLHMAEHFKDEPRIQFIIPEGMHSYLDVYGQVIRFQHGHAIKYAGGVGGIYIPVNKAIGQWNKARRADLDVFGHFHQMRDGGNFVCNGSLIGYNAFALSIKADYEPPKQVLFLMDKKRGRTATWPILVNS